MHNLRGALVAAAAAFLLLIPCAAQSQAHTRDLAALDSVTSGIMTLPITTSSADARNHFLQGQRELDLGRAIDAHAHFQAAVAADSGFALAYLDVANTGNSLAEFNTNLALAERHATTAVSDAERILIQISRLGTGNDVNGQLVLAQQLVAKYPESPRAYLVLAGVQGALNRNADARTSIMKAVGLAPRLLVAHTDLGNSYLFGEPKDFAKSLEHMQHAAALAPNEPYMHDLLGDVYRAQNNLDQARSCSSAGTSTPLRGTTPRRAPTTIRRSRWAAPTSKPASAPSGPTSASMPATPRRPSPSSTAWWQGSMRWGCPSRAV